LDSRYTFAQTIGLRVQTTFQAVIALTLQPNYNYKLITHFDNNTSSFYTDTRVQMFIKSQVAVHNIDE